MATITFATLKFVERLKAADVPEAQAKAEAEAFAEALSATGQVGQLATRINIESLRSEIERVKIGHHQMGARFTDRPGCFHRCNGHTRLN